MTVAHLDLQILPGWSQRGLLRDPFWEGLFLQFQCFRQIRGPNLESIFEIDFGIDLGSKMKPVFETQFSSVFLGVLKLVSNFEPDFYSNLGPKLNTN